MKRFPVFLAALAIATAAGAQGFVVHGNGDPRTLTPTPNCALSRFYVDDTTQKLYMTASGSPCVWKDSNAASGGVTPGGVANSIQGQDGAGNLLGGPATVISTTGAVNASVNTQMNVMMFGAKGDCTTDDHNAIVAAMAAAQALKVGNGSPAVVYFPKPPGGCYLTSTIEYTGVPLVGQPSGDGVSIPPYGVTIKGMPGYDILHAPDPSQTTFTWNISWLIHDISFLVDGSVAPTTTTVPNLLHRWPGRWFDDGAITSGSAVFTTSRGNIGCADIGQAIQVNGADVAGGNLVTTIAAVDPCWSVANGGASGWKVVTLAATASTTVTNAHSYISILDLPVTKNVGNCAMAFDNLDANPADFISPMQRAGSNHSIMDHVNFTNVSSGGQGRGVCGVFAQGVWNSFNTLHADHVNFYGLGFGLVEAPSEINSYYSTGGDFQHWDHMQFFTEYYPWIVYNGGESEADHIQITAFAGPQFMNAPNNFADVASWSVNIQEMESWNIPSDTRFGLRTEGSGFNINGEMSISADSANQAWIDSSFTTCNCFTSPGQIHMFGVGNNIVGDANGTAIDNKGRGNTALAYNNGGGYPAGIPPPAANALLPQKGVPNIISGIEPDFAGDGFPATPYRHEDFFLTPSDFLLGTAGTDQWKNLYQADTNSLTGAEVFIHTGANITQWWPWQYSNPAHPGNLTIGTNFPAAKGTLYLSLLCPTATSSQINFNSSSGKNNILSITCSTSLATYAVPFDFTGATGNIGLKDSSSTSGQDFWLAWAYIDIAPQLPAGTTIGGAAPATQLGPTSGTAATDLACFTNTTGSFADCNSSAGANVTLPSTNIFLVKSRGGPAYLKLQSASTSWDAYMSLFGGSTKYWSVGMLADSTNWNLSDATNTHNVVSFPNNTMPANSLGGNANGATAITEAATDSSVNVATTAFVKSLFAPQTALTVANGTTVAANACVTGTAVTITGTQMTTRLPYPTPNADPTGVTGFGPSESTLYFVPWPTLNTYNWKLCNNSASSITTTASTTWNIGGYFF